MKNQRQKGAMFLAGALLVMGSLAGCDSMSPRQQDTAIGAVGGGVLGSVLTGGSALGTVGGAAVGGVVGNSVGR